MSTSDRLPSAWVRAKLIELGSWKGGGTPSKADTRFWVGGSVPWVSPKDMKTAEIHEAEDHITEAACRETPAHKVPKGSVLVVTRSGILRRTLPVAVTCVDAAFNQDLKALVPDSGILPEFVFYALRRHEGELLHECVKEGTTVQSVEIPQFLDFELPIAPANEQRRIADALDDHFTRLDAAEAALKRAQARLKRFRASVLQAAVEGRLVPTEAELARREGRSYEPASVLLARVIAERRKRFEASGKRGKHVEPARPDVANLPELPEGWCWATVDQLASVGTGATPRRGNPRYYSGGTIPWVTSRVARQARVVEADEFVTEAALAETNLALYPAGTLLVAMYGEGVTRGSCTELAIPATTNQALAAVELCEGVGLDRAYLRLVFERNYERLRRTASGGVQPNLNLALVKGMQVPLPPAVEQPRIVEAASALATRAEAVGSALERSDSRSKRLRQAILALAFEGGLVDPDPSDEPAYVLLERIRAARAQAASNGSQKVCRTPRRPKTTT